jgi:translocation and assembly module TamB
VYPTLPREGGGRMKLAIRSEDDPRIVDYVITDMNVQSTFSRLRGDMTFGIGGPLVIVKDVDLVADPLDFRLIETLGGQPLPLPWRGTLTGRVRGRGGPLDRFAVDSASIVFRDANVPGAVAAGRVSGGLDIRRPSLAVFHGLRVELDRLDLRTLQFLNPEFPRFDGIVAGRATLDSSWIDVRFRDANITHGLGDTPPTRMLGGGRVTFGEDVTTYDLAVTAQPLAFATVAAAYQGGRVPLRGEFQGPVRMQGTIPDLAISTELRGAAGTLAYDGRVDADSAGGYAVNGTLRLLEADLSRLFDTVFTPPTSLTGAADLDLTGDSLATLSGRAVVQLDRSTFDELRIYPGSRAQMRFGDGLLRLDTLYLETVPGKLAARGALGLRPDVRDSLVFAVAVDSLGGFRRYFVRDETIVNGDVATDSLEGSFDARGVLTGSLDTLGVRAALEGVRLRVNASGARVLRARMDLANVRHAPTGTITLGADTVVLAGVQLRDLGGELTLDAGRSGLYNLMAQSVNGPVLASKGAFRLDGDTTLLRVDSLGLLIDDHRLALVGGTTVRVEPAGIVVDTALLRGTGGEQLMFAAAVPDSAPLNATFRAESLHLGDLGRVFQTRLPLGGTLNAHLTAAGTRQALRLDGRGIITGASVGRVTVASVVMEGGYAARRFRGDLQLVQQGARVLEASANIPYDLENLRAFNDSMRVSLRSQDVDLGLVETFTPVIRNSSGRFSADLDLVGRGDARVLTGSLRVEDGAGSFPDANIRLRRVNADLVAERDTLRVNRLSLVSGESSGDSLWLTRGNFIAHLLQPDSTRAFDLRFRARNFHAIGRPDLADLYMSADVSLRGTWASSVASGAVDVNSGHIAIPDLPDKQLFTINDPDFLERERETLERLNLIPRTFGLAQGLSVPNLTVRVGPDVWLQSNDARIKLADSLDVTVIRPRGGGEPQLALEGTLRTERGVYILNLGVVRPSFNIESGEIRFLGDTTFNPELDITAIHRVRQISSTYGGRHEIRIGVQLRGTLENPVLNIFSADSLQMSQSDLMSYLVTGAPGFGIGGSRENVSTASAILLGTASSAFSSFATRVSGGFFDWVQLQTASDQLRVGAPQRYNPLEGAQLGIGKQVNDNTFLSVNTGFCPFLPQGNFNPASVWESLGMRLEHTFGEGYGVSVSREPPFNVLVCSQAIPPGLLPAQSQWGFDLFRIWR